MATASVFKNIMWSKNIITRMVHLTQITAKKNVEAVLSLEPPVKKPASAYNLFVQELHRKLKQGNPDLQSKEIFKIASEEWKNCPEDKKRRLNQTALAEKSVYLAEKEKYNDSLTVEQRIELANAKKEAKLLAERKEKKEQTKQKQKELGIVRPKSAFLSFIQDERRNYETLNKEVISVIAQKWHKLPENVKSKYTSKFETEYAIYKDKLQEWKKLNEE